MCGYKIMQHGRSLRKKKHPIISFHCYISLPMIALKRKYDNIVAMLYYTVHSWISSHFLWHSTFSYRKIPNISEDLCSRCKNQPRTSANYRLARKSSSRGPNAAFARVTEIRKNFYTL